MKCMNGNDAIIIIIIIIISEYLHRIYTSIYKIAITVCPVRAARGFLFLF